MSAGTSIEWTDYTFNPWWGCTEVSPGCDNCYARNLARRFGVGWGLGAERRTFGADHWAEPLRWNAKAEREGKRRRVFCASMADLFEPGRPAGELERLWALIRVTPWLDWQLLTKRPQFIAKNLPDDWGHGYRNVWLGTSVESQEYAWRIGKLLATPAAVRFLSCEPLLGPLDLWGPNYTIATGVRVSAFAWGKGINWVIVGGESGPGARPVDLAWVRSIVADCRGGNCAVFVKQLGARPYNGGGMFAHQAMTSIRLGDPKGGAIGEWPADLQVREFPDAN